MLVIPNERYWLLDQRHADTLMAAAHQAATTDAATRLAARGGGQQPKRQTTGQIAIIPVTGGLEAHPTFLGMLTGATAMDVIGTQFLECIADPSVSKIVFRVDSPGGTAAGTPELANLIVANRGRKEIYGFIDGMAASAGYWIASAVDRGRLFMTPSGEVGSIGCFAMHLDRSEQLAKDGVKATIIRAPEWKAEFNPLEPLSQSARDYEQASVSKLYGEFVLAVSRHRGVSQQQVVMNFGRGRTVDSDHAIANHMVDKVMSFPQFVEMLLADTSKSPAGSTRGYSMSAEESRLRADHAKRVNDGHRRRVLGNSTRPKAVKSLGEIGGYATMWNQVVSPSNANGKQHLFTPSAFDNALASNADVVLTVDHNYDKIASRRSESTLSLSRDEYGLVVRAKIPDTAAGREIMDGIQSGELTGMSCSYHETEARYLKSAAYGEFVEISDASLAEVCVTDSPANKDTSVWIIH